MTALLTTVDSVLIMSSEPFWYWVVGNLVLQKTRGALQSTWIASQLCHSCKATQAVRGTDDITTLNFLSQFNSMNELHHAYLKLVFVFTAVGLKAEPSFINFDS